MRDDAQHVAGLDVGRQLRQETDLGRPQLGAESGSPARAG